MTRSNLITEYFRWLSDLACGDRYSTGISYSKLLYHLHNTTFRYSMLMDENRAEDGKDLRYRFAISECYDESPELILDCLDGPCSVLEMMVALSIRCEETIMDDTDYGDRTRQWFWDMIINLGLGSMTDDRFDVRFVDEVLNRFLDREYEPNGVGGLIMIINCDVDLRTIEIWRQLCLYLDSIT